MKKSIVKKKAKSTGAAKKIDRQLRPSAKKSAKANSRHMSRVSYVYPYKAAPKKINTKLFSDFRKAGFSDFDIEYAINAFNRKDTDSLKLMMKKDTSFIDKMITDSKLDTQRAKKHIDSLNQNIVQTEKYHHTTFPAPVKDFLDYIKLNKQNLNSWESLKSFINVTDMFWKLMRDQTFKIAVNAAKKLKYNELPKDIDYREKIIDIYIKRLEKEIANNESNDELKSLLDLILGYNEHESTVIERQEW